MLPSGHNPNINVANFVTETQFYFLPITTMPKVPTPLYNHASRNATARQLNISSTVSGRSSYSYTSSQVPLEPVAPESHPAHEYYTNDEDVDMDIDDAPGDLNTADEDDTVEAAPGVHVHIVPPKAKRYENSVSQFFRFYALTNPAVAGCPSVHLGKMPK
jgi:hypothetical protein